MFATFLERLLFHKGQTVSLQSYFKNRRIRKKNMANVLVTIIKEKTDKNVRYNKLEFVSTIRMFLLVRRFESLQDLKCCVFC